MDLTKSYPASVKTKLHGLVQIQRAIDKGKAFAAGSNGEYNYDCPMDKAVFDFLGMDGEALLNVIKGAKSDQEINDYVGTFVHKKTAAEIEAWNAQWLSRAPEKGSESEKYFLNLRDQVAPDSRDVSAWADLLDLDEKRQVPVGTDDDARAGTVKLANASPKKGKTLTGDFHGGVFGVLQKRSSRRRGTRLPACGHRTRLLAGPDGSRRGWCRHRVVASRGIGRAASRSASGSAGRRLPVEGSCSR